MLSHFALTLAQETQFGDLPWDFVALVLLRLPVDARLRAREVSRGWRALLNDPRFWMVLDFSPYSGVEACITRALLFAAGERGRGHLHALDLTGAMGLTGTEGLRSEHLVQFVAAHGQSLRSVTAPEGLQFSADEVTRLCLSAPLCTLRCYVWCTAAEELPLLRCEAPCALLHIFKLWVTGFNNQEAVLDLAAALPSHSGKIKELTVWSIPLPTGAVADAFMRGIAEARVSDVTFYDFLLTPASVPGLTRLLQAGCLETLVINNNFGLALFEEGPHLTAFCHALRSSTLQALELNWCRLWRDPAAAGELLAALVGHQTLRELSLPDVLDETDDAHHAAGEQVASLITHNSALQKLDLTLTNLGDAGLAPIFVALPRSSTLKELGFSFDTVSRVVARYIVLPAVRANTSLRTLSFSNDDDGEPFPELVEAQAIVAART